MEVTHRARFAGRGSDLPHPLQTQPLSLNVHVSPAWKLSKPRPFGVFMEAALHSHGSLNHRPLPNELPLQPLFPPLSSVGRD